MEKEPTSNEKRVLFLPPPLKVFAGVENHFRKEGVRFGGVEDHRELANRMTEARPFLLVLDLFRLSASVFEVLPRIQDCSDGCKVIVFGRESDLQTLSAKPLKDIVFFPDVLDAHVLSTALGRILKNGWGVFKRNCVLKSPYSLLFCHSNEMNHIKTIVDQVAPTDIAALICGERGTGKDLVAQAIHLKSTRCHKPFIKVNCAAGPSAFLEGELFGFEKGAFPGAGSRKPGKLELANEGTLFLDEIGDLDGTSQTKLLRTLKNEKFCRLGGRNSIAFKCRIIASTKSDLRSAVETGGFREDLYYRLNAASIPLPPLRLRREEISSLAQYFLDLYNFRYGRSCPTISKETEKLFHSYDWPGNIRELKRTIKQIVVSNDERGVVRKKLEKPSARSDTAGSPSCGSLSVEGDEIENLKEVGRRAAKEAEMGIIQKMLEETRWNRRATAKLLQISYKALLYKIKEYGLDQ